MMVDGPLMRSCSECWVNMNSDDVKNGRCANGHDAPPHEWNAQVGAFVVRHPALPVPLIGRFAYPVNPARVLRWIVRSRRSLERLLVDPDAARTEWYCVPDQAPPESLAKPVDPVVIVAQHES